jgi:hypothetical protein
MSHTVLVTVLDGESLTSSAGILVSSKVGRTGSEEAKTNGMYNRTAQDVRVIMKLSRARTSIRSTSLERYRLYLDTPGYALIPSEATDLGIYGREGLPSRAWVWS